MLKHLTTVVLTAVAVSLLAWPSFEAKGEGDDSSTTEEVRDPDEQAAQIKALEEEIEGLKSGQPPGASGFSGPPSREQVCQKQANNGGDDFYTCMRKLKEIDNDTQNSSTESRCSRAETNYEKAKSEFGQACPNSGFDTQATESSGQLYCSAHVSCCMGSPTGGDFCEEQSGWYRDQAAGQDIQDTLSEVLEDISNADGNVDPFQITQFQNQANNLRLQSSLLQCPQKARVGLEQAVEDADAAREKLEEKQERLAEMQEELQLARIEVEESTNETNDEIREETRRARQALQAIEDGLEGQLDNISDEIKRLSEDIVTAGEEKGQATQATQAAQTEKIQAEDELYLSCLTRAEELIQTRRAACVNAAATVNAPGAERSQGCSSTMTEIFKQQGMTLIERMQSQVDDEVEICLNSPRVKRQEEQINRLYQQTIDNLSVTISNIDNRIQLIQTDIDELRVQDSQDAYSKNLDDLQELQTSHQENMQSIQAKGATNLQRAKTKVSSIEQKIALYRQHVQNAQEGLSAKQAILNSRQSFAGGDGDIKTENFAKAQAGYYALVGSTNALINACCDGGDLEARTGSCEFARSFSRTHGGVDGKISGNRDGVVPDIIESR